MGGAQHARAVVAIIGADGLAAERQLERAGAAQVRRASCGLSAARARSIEGGTVRSCADCVAALRTPGAHALVGRSVTNKYCHTPGPVNTLE